MKLKILTFALATIAVTTAGIADDAIRARGILVAASNEKRDSDARLSEYVPILRRVLRFESYRFLGSGSGPAPEGASTSVSLGDGHSLQITVESIKGDQIRARVSWLGGGRTIMNTVLVLRRGVPAVFGGPKDGNEVLAVIMVVS